MSAKRHVAVALGWALALALPAAAQDATKTGTQSGTSSTQSAAPAAAPAAGTKVTAKPVDIESDQMEVFDNDKKAVFRGHVVAKRPDVTLNTDELTVLYADTPQPDGTTKTDVTHLHAVGSVVIVTAKEKVTGEAAEMNPKTNDLDVTGNVVVTQGATVLHGNHFHDNLNTHKMEMTGGRVKGSFLPK